MTEPIRLFSGGGLQVRWGTFSQSVSERPWRDCEEVSVAGPFLVVAHGTGMTVIPDHVIRGNIEVRVKPRD